MWVTVRNLWTKLTRATDDERSWLEEALRYRRRVARQETVEELFDPLNQRFATGYLGLVIRAARQAGISVEMIDKRQAPCAPDEGADLSWLRDYQRESVRRCAQATRGLVDAPTGSGKTEAMIGLVRYLPCRWLMVCNSMDLVQQFAKRYELRTGEEAGVIGDGKWRPGERLTCATFQTLAKRSGTAAGRELLRSAEGLLVDEAHTTPASTFWNVAMATTSAYYRFGFSGTPLARGDKKNLYTIGALGRVVHRVETGELVERKLIVRPHVRMVPVYQTTAKRKWHSVYRELIADSKTRNELIADLAAEAEKPALVFVQQKAHGQALRKMIAKRQAWGRVEFVWGDTAQVQRDEAIARMRRGDTSVIVCSVVFQTGIDIPELRSLLIASGMKSVIATIQRVGRGMRPDLGKRTLEVWDVLDTGTKVLEGHSRKRRRAYIRAGYEVSDEEGLARAEPDDRSRRVARANAAIEARKRDDMTESI